MNNLNFNLNSDTYSNNISAPFNKGVAGIVEATIKEIKREEKDGRHRWVMTYQDKDGGTLNDFFNYLDVSHPNIEKQLKGQGTTLKHLWNAIVGAVELPVFTSPEDMLDTVMKTLSSKGQGVPLRLVVDYGVGDRHNTRLNRKRYVPFLERIVGDSSRLFMQTGAHMEPAKPSDTSSFLKSEPNTSAPNGEDSGNAAGNQWFNQ